MTTQTLARPLTAGDNPDGVRMNPQLRKAAGPLDASEQKRGGQRRKELKKE